MNLAELGAALSCEGMVLPEVGDSDVAIAFAGIERSYRMHVPRSYTGQTPVPLVLNIHGLTQDGPIQQLASQLDVVAEEHGFVTVYPSSDSGTWNAGACCNITGPDDVTFMREVVADVRRRSCIDPTRIYATGMSNGGIMSHRLACDAADLFAAVAPVAGILPVPDADCRPQRPVPLLQVHGTNDDLVDYDGGGVLTFIWTDPFTPLLSAHATIADWARRDGCGSALSAPTSRQDYPVKPVSGGLISGAGAPLFSDDQARLSAPATPGAVCEWYGGCKGGAEVGLCSHDGGHDWASGSSMAIWQFFQRHRLP